MKYLLIVLLLFTVASNGDDINVKVENAFELYSVDSFDEAIPLFEEVFTLLNNQKHKDITALMKVSFYSALCQRGLNDYQASKNWLDRALMYAEILQDIKTIPKIYALLGEVEIYNGRVKQANNYYHKALSYQTISEKDRAVLFYSLAESYRLLKGYSDALEFCDKAKELAGSLKLDKVVLSCNIIEAEILRLNGDYAKSLQLFSSCLDVARARGFADISIMALSGKGLVSEKLERQDIARANFEEALAISLKNNKFYEIEPIIMKIAELMPQEAKLHRQASELFELINSNARLNSEPIRVDLWNLLALYYKASGEINELSFVYEASYTDAIAFDDNESAVKALINLAELSYIQKDYKSVVGHIEEATERGNSLIDKWYQVKIDYLLSLINEERTD